MRLSSLLTLFFAISLLLIFKPVSAEARSPSSVTVSTVCRDVLPELDLARAERVYLTFSNVLPKVRMHKDSPADREFEIISQTVTDSRAPGASKTLVRGDAREAIYLTMSYEFDANGDGTVDLIVENSIDQATGVIVRQRIDVDTDFSGIFERTLVADVKNRNRCLEPQFSFEAWSMDSESPSPQARSFKAETSRAARPRTGLLPTAEGKAALVLIQLLRSGFTD